MKLKKYDNFVTADELQDQLRDKLQKLLGNN